MKLLNKRGDTIIEVVLAMSLLAFVLFSAWAITNRASQLNLTARQRVVMVNQLKEQAELLKSLYQVDQNALKDAALNATTVSANPCNDIDLSKADDAQGAGKLNKAMIVALNTSTGKPEVSGPVKTKAVDGDSSQRVWIQKQVPTGASVGYADFLIRSCWQVTGNTQKLDNSQFVVRLNL